MDIISGSVESIIYQNPETGFTIAKILPKATRGNHTSSLCIVGQMAGLQPGEFIRCDGSWKTHLVYGKQFEVESFAIEMPSTETAIEKYLGSGLIHGIGPVYAKRIVETFGSDTLTIIDQAPHRLKEVSGLGKKRIGTILECWSRQMAVRNVMLFLQSHGLSPTYAQKIYQVFGDNSIEKVQENPYCLSRDIFGIGFTMADRVAKELGILHNAPTRIDAGIDHVLLTLSQNGHTCYPMAMLVPEAAAILDVNTSDVAARIDALYEKKVIAIDLMVYEGVDQPFVFPRHLYNAEQAIAKELKRLLGGTIRMRAVDSKKAIAWAEEKLGIELAEGQREAVESALTEKLLIITGGPGTGKSTICRTILAITQKITGHILLAAPTGRAAKRMSEITGCKSATIHSLLEFDWKKGGFKRNEKNPLDCDLLIIDEASMIDTPLMAELLRAVPNRARLLFVGDIHQLPSVGPGNVLKEIIASKAVPVVMLTRIFRQAESSRIVTNAHRINSGEFPDISSPKDSDFFFIEAEKPEEVLDNIVSLVAKRLPNRFGFDSIDDIQVLAPMKKGVIGTINLNEALQKALNPKAQKTSVARGYFLNDKVMQTRNNYQKEVYNGDIGRITAIDAESQELIVCYDDRDIPYKFSELDEIQLAYAVSIHKYQGSEAPAIVIPIHTTHFKLLTRNLLYTGVTRGKKLVVLVGMKKALFIAVNNDEVKTRFSGLLNAIIKKTLGKSPAPL